MRDRALDWLSRANPWVRLRDVEATCANLRGALDAQREQIASLRDDLTAACVANVERHEKHLGLLREIDAAVKRRDTLARVAGRKRR